MAIVWSLSYGDIAKKAKLKYNDATHSGHCPEMGDASRIFKPAIDREHHDEPVDGMLQYPIISDKNILFSFSISNMGFY